MPPTDVPKGLKSKLKSTAPSKFKKGKFAHFSLLDPPTKLKGITKRLTEKLYSNGELPKEAVSAPAGWKPTVWAGDGGGLRRGRAVDSQCCRLAAMSDKYRKMSQTYKITRFVFNALEKAGLEPIMGQRCVASARHRLGTGCDLVCWNKETRQVVVVELKTGFRANINLPAVNSKKKPLNMNSPCSTAADCILHRHFAQLAVTHFMLASEPGLLTSLKKMGVVGFSASLLYANDSQTTLFELPNWWKKRGNAITEAIGAA